MEDIRKPPMRRVFTTEAKVGKAPTVGFVLAHLTIRKRRLSVAGPWLADGSGSRIRESG